MDGATVKIIHQPTLFVVGPTASGKSDLALRVAEQHGGVIINFDSVQFYEELLIGSAAPNEAQKRRVPHYLYSYVKYPVVMTAGQFVRDFVDLFSELTKTLKPHQPLIFVGGTGFYIQALEKGMFDIPEVPTEIKQQILDESVQSGGPVRMWKELNEFDPNHGLHENDLYRIGRALEVKRAFGLSMSSLKERSNKRSVEFTNLLKIGVDLSKDELNERILKRAEQMLANGLIEETQSVLKKAGREWAPLSSVGYHEVMQFLNGELKREELDAAIAQSTRQLAKKQRTWFKRDQSLLWSNRIDVEGALKQFLLNGTSSPS